MERFKKMIIAPVLSLILLIAFGGNAFCVQSKITLRIGYIPLLSELPLIVSYESNQLNFENVTAELVRYNSFTALEAAMRVGAIDVASLPIPIVLSIAADGHKMKIIGICHLGGSRLWPETKAVLRRFAEV